MMNYMELFSLKGKTALVTGGTHGLGMAIGKALAGAGARLVINDLSREKLDHAVKQYAAEGVDVLSYVADVTREQSVMDMLDSIERDHGPVDILVNNAGIIKRIPALEMSVEDYEQVLKVDLTGPFIVSKQVAKRMVARNSGGKIINMCSMMSEMGRSSVSAYAAAKGGLKMLTKNLATEWAKYNIQVNGIGPGYFATEQTAPIRVNGHPFNEFIIHRTPAGRWGVPDDLAGAAIFLASPASDFITGQVIYVDGGILATIGKAYSESY